MCLVLAAAVAELLELETASGRLLVLRRRVVPLLAHRALQIHDFPHIKLQFFVQLSVFSDQFFSSSRQPDQLLRRRPN